MIEREWKTEYNIGCDYVDAAHRKLFNILWKVLDLISERDYEKHKHACIESIKFLYNYTATHFTEEEKYMQEIGYVGYEAHKKVHEEVKNEIVPMHDRALQESNYSKEKVREFVGFFSGWLTGHILVMDKAITDSTLRKINALDISVNEKIIKEIADFSQRFSEYRLTVVGQTYDNCVYEDAIYYELTYGDVIVLFMVQNGSVKKIVSEMTGKTVEVIDKSVLISFIQLMMYAGRMVYYSVSAEMTGKPDSHRLIASKDIAKLIENRNLTNYVEWNAENGNMAVWVFG